MIVTRSTYERVAMQVEEPISGVLVGFLCLNSLWPMLRDDQRDGIDDRFVKSSKYDSEQILCVSLTSRSSGRLDDNLPIWL